MALSILDGTQTATTLSTILSSGQHITAHTVVSLGTQAITDMRSAVSGSVVSVSSLPAISGTVTANAVGYNYQETSSALIPLKFDGGDNFYVPIGPSVDPYPLPISGTVTIGSALPAGTNRIGVVTIGAGTVTIGAGTAQIGSVTASISGTVPISISSVTVGNSVTIGSLPAISGTVTANVGNISSIIGGGYNDLFSLGDDGQLYVQASVSNFPASQAISGTVTANLSISATAITSGSFSSLTSATLVPANTARKMATVYNLGAGQLFVNAGASATTLGGGFMVALSSGDFFECNYTTTTLSAIFATAGTASWMSH